MLDGWGNLQEARHSGLKSEVVEMNRDCILVICMSGGVGVERDKCVGAGVGVGAQWEKNGVGDDECGDCGQDDGVRYDAVEGFAIATVGEVCCSKGSGCCEGWEDREEEACLFVRKNGVEKDICCVWDEEVERGFSGTGLGERIWYEEGSERVQDKSWQGGGEVIVPGTCTPCGSA